jgi:hypothetical protein
MKISLLMVPLVLAGCTTSSMMTSDQKENHWKPHMSAYVRCNSERALEVSRQSGDPLSLGTAVTGMCGQQALDLRKALNDIHGPGFANSMMEKIESTQVRYNAAAIVKARS